MFAQPDAEDSHEKKKTNRTERESKQSSGKWFPIKGMIIKNYKSLTCPQSWKIIHRWWVEIGLPLLYFPISSKLKQSILTCQSGWRREAPSGNRHRGPSLFVAVCQREKICELSRLSLCDYYFPNGKFKDNFTAFVFLAQGANKVRLKGVPQKWL